MTWLDELKYIRTQVRTPDEMHVIVEFVNGSRACSCGLERGITPNLRRSE